MTRLKMVRGVRAKITCSMILRVLIASRIWGEVETISLFSSSVPSLFLYGVQLCNRAITTFFAPRRLRLSHLHQLHDRILGGTGIGATTALHTVGYSQPFQFLPFLMISVSSQRARIESHRTGIHTASAANAHRLGGNRVLRFPGGKGKDARGRFNNRHLQGILRQAHHRPAHNDFGRFFFETATCFYGIRKGRPQRHHKIGWVAYRRSGHCYYPLYERHPGGEIVGNRVRGAYIVNDYADLHRQAAFRHLSLQQALYEYLFCSLRIPGLYRGDLEAAPRCALLYFLVCLRLIIFFVSIAL